MHVELIDLGPYFNNDGISYLDDPTDGDFDFAGNTYPANELPPSNKLIEFNSITFKFPDKENGQNNNLILEGQMIVVPKDSYSRIAILGASDIGRYCDGFIKDKIELLDDGKCKLISEMCLHDWVCIDEQRAYGVEFIRCSKMHTIEGAVFKTIKGYDSNPTIWFESIELESKSEIDRIKFPDNPSMHIFSISLVRE